MIFNTKSSYGIVSRIFHWVISIFIITMICVGFYMTSLEPSDNKYDLYRMHKASGFIIFIFILMRVIWRFQNVTTELPSDTPHWQSAASRIVHYILYFFMIAMPTTGILMSLFSGRAIDIFGLFVIPAFAKKTKYALLFNELHSGFVIIFTLIILIHILAAFYHHFIKKDNILRRMITGS